MLYTTVVKGTFLVAWILACWIVGLQCQPQLSIPNKVATLRYPFVTSLDMEGDNTKFILKWGFNTTHIWFEVQANTLGYVGFGISKTGLMVQADVVVGYISQGNITLADYHTTQYAHPTLDTSQDWLLEDGYEVDGWTVLSFARRLDTCDTTGDIPITLDTQHLIYSYHSEDPVRYDQLVYHQRRGAKPVNLLTSIPPPTQVTTDVNVVEFVNNFSIPMRDTAHHCRLFSLAGTSIAGAKHHIIKISPIFPISSIINVRKVTLFRCRFPDPSILQGLQQFDCFRDGAGHQQHCKEYVASFVPGSEKTMWEMENLLDFYLPEDVGLSFGGPGGAELYSLATEYNNENFENVVDTSGISLWYTPTLRPNDAAFLTIASPIAVGWHQFIPTGEENFIQRAYCPRSCFKWGFDATTETRITLIGAQFQGRYRATAMRLRHMVPGNGQGNTVVETPWVLDNRKYSDSAQTVQKVDERHVVSAGHTLLLECSYNTTAVSANYTIGGWGDDDELCRAHVLYYPPIPLEGCLSWSMYSSLRDHTGAPIPSQEVFSTLRAIDWRAANVRTFLRQSLETSDESTQCWSSRQTPTVHADSFSHPEISNPYRKPQLSTCPRV